MTGPAIVVERLSKSYRLVSRAKKHDTFRDLVADTLAASFRRLRGRRTAAGGGENTFWALKDVSFRVEPGEVVGIVGRNGAGKSTLLKILSRITEPTTGTVRLRGRVASLLEVGTGFHPELSGRENIYLNGAMLGMKRVEINRKFDEIVTFSEVEKFLDTPVKRYSSGMYVRLAFAVAAHLEPEILIVDEVLAVGDAEFQRKCLGKMQDVSRSQGRTVLFVTHNMNAMQRLCSRGILLNEGCVKRIGTAAEVVELYNSRLANRATSDAGSDPHVLYSAAPGAEGHGCEIFRVATFRPDGQPLARICSGDDVVIRFWFRATKLVQRGSVELRISTVDGVRLLVLSTQPDGTLPLRFEEGVSSVDCLIEGMPLASGDYVFGAFLAVPDVEYLWRNDDLAGLHVYPRDLYGSGLPPVASRCLLAVRHHWRVGGDRDSRPIPGVDP